MASEPPAYNGFEELGRLPTGLHDVGGLRVVRVHRIAEQDLVELVGIGAGRHRDTLDGRVGAPAVPPGLHRLLDVPLQLRLGRQPEPAAVDLDGGEVGDPEGRGAKVGIDGVGDTLRPAAPRVAGHPLVWEGVGPVVGEDDRRRCRIVRLRSIQQLAPVDPQVRSLRGQTGVDPLEERTHLHHFVTTWRLLRRFDTVHLPGVDIGRGCGRLFGASDQPCESDRASSAEYVRYAHTRPLMPGVRLGAPMPGRRLVPRNLEYL